jgi:hypothetical protein
LTQKERKKTAGFRLDNKAGVGRFIMQVQFGLVEKKANTIVFGIAARSRYQQK